MFWFFGCEARGILAPQPGIKPAPPALDGKVLTTGPPGKSLNLQYFYYPWLVVTVKKKDKAMVKSWVVRLAGPLSLG